MTGMSFSSELTDEQQKNGTLKSREPLQKQLGLGTFQKDYRDRQIMQLEVGVHNSNYSKPMTGAKNLCSYTSAVEDLYEEDWTTRRAAHAVRVSLIQDMRATGNPGSAMQAPDFRLNSTISYECALPSMVDEAGRGSEPDLGSLTAAVQQNGPVPIQDKGF
ncbi:hypothetical protein F25303_3583 [Fusarium sp. NRRL 25303]|nr:hypothetical protein F25303_3583 [Fusarium sp. NRRL 25303]